jgi:hypothetical protein
MRSLLLAALLLAAPAQLAAADLLAEARRLYNLGQYDDAERVARDAAANVALVDRARVVLGRVHLEQYRRSADPAQLASARAALRATDPRALDLRERVELTVGLAEALYLEDRFGAAAEMFEAAMAAAADLGPAADLGAPAYERMLDWWATSLDRVAQSRRGAERTEIYDRIERRMTYEIRQDPGSLPGGYWVIAAARGRGDVERAYDAAMAGWVRAIYARDRGNALRADIDRVVAQAILPERAARLPGRDQKGGLNAMLSEWEAFKANWNR